MVRHTFLLTLVFAFAGLAFQAHGQTTSLTSTSTTNNSTRIPATTPTPSRKQVQIQGLVIEQKKYSIKVKSDQGLFTVKVANGAPIALKMSRPWFDWNNKQVVVDKPRFPIDLNEKPDKRAAINFPADTLYLITRFAEKSQLDYVMTSSEIKRINFYLVTPEDLGENYPSEDKLYLSGKLLPRENEKVFLKVKNKILPIKLGYQFATMNGFSIMELKPNQTKVYLTGLVGENESEILATRVLFEPVIIE